ncbi:MAG: DUF4968 domain-containing protein [Chitinispirillaceae bacterium]|nr:DUF4968 domain-containing protein [Chitinispirillaceae bacterium]
MNSGSILSTYLRHFFAQFFLAATLGLAAPVGDYVSHTRDSNLVEFSTGGTQKVRIYVCTPSIVRISFDARGLFTSTKDVLSMEDVNREWPAVAFTIDSTSDSGAIVIETSELKIRVQKAPFRISYYKADGSYLTGDAAAMESQGARATNPAFTFTQESDEHYFGWGLAQPWYREWRNIDNKGSIYDTPVRTSHSSLPGAFSTGHYMYSTNGFGIWFLFPLPAPQTTFWISITIGVYGAGFDLRDSTAKYWMSPYDDSYGSGYGPMQEYVSYFFINGPSWKESMDKYTKISGRPPRLGKKYYGIMRDMYYRSGTTIESFRGWADMFRSNRFNMDWIRMDNFFDWTNLGYLPEVPNAGCWDSEVPNVIQYYRDKGFLFGGMSAGWKHYGCCSAGCTKNLLQDSIHIKTAIDHGFDFAWYDAMAYFRRQVAKEQWDVWKAAYGGDETKVFISRGYQALSSQSWPGNTSSDYLNQKTSSSGNIIVKYPVFPSALMEHLVGYAWSHTSLGEGYDFNYIGISLRPMIGFHMAGAAGGSARNFEECGRIGAYPEDLKNVMRKWGNFHYQFIPYLFTYGMIAHETGIPPWRGMMCQNGGERDPQTYNCAYQCYVGEELIVSPYYDDNPEDLNSGARHNIYLPPISSGVWYDYFEGTKYAAGTTIESYMCDPGKGRDSLRLPLFVKAGSIIPLMDTLQFVGERPESLITLQIWPTNGTSATQTGSFTLYEDEGTSNTPASKTEFSYSFSENGEDQQTTVTIGLFAGSRYCSTSTERVYRIEIHNVRQVRHVMSSSTVLPELADSQYHAGANGWIWDERNGGICRINATGDASAGFEVVAGTTGAGIERERMLPAIQKVSITRQRSGLKIEVPFVREHRVEILNIQGRLLTARHGKKDATYHISLEGKPSMVYLVRIRSGATSMVRKLSW